MVNKVILVGFLGRDPETHDIANGIIARFSVATSERWKKDGETVEKTEWHRIATFGHTAEFCSRYLTKGRQVYIEGKLQTREWEDKEGVRRYTTEIVAHTVQALGPKKEGASDDAPPPEEPDARSDRVARARAVVKGPRHKPDNGGAEDIPF